MKANPSGVLTGVHFLDGDQACAEGALAAGCRFAAGYPITPSTEIVERFAQRVPLMGGMFLQMEDELASSIAIQGAVWAGAKAFTVTSGPGFSLMMEHIGYAAMTETPCVFVNVQRGGPSTGLPTLPAQGDMMQARWGSHGDYEIIAVAPSSPQECFDLTIAAFNLSERYRVPVMVMMDECVGHMTERVVIPPADQIEIQPRRYTERKPGDYLPFRVEFDDIPGMVRAGDGYRFHITGVTHNDHGYLAANTEWQKKVVERIVNKIRARADEIAMCEEHNLGDAEVVVVAYGISARVARAAVEMARQRGIRAGLLRPQVVWPFPETRIRQLAAREGMAGFVVVELNLGQISLEVERLAAGRVPTDLLGHAGGSVHHPEEVLERILRVARGREVAAR
ncbi:MAG TPA: 2-oxoacid:acceptor oxidoreductase subunit alpha [Candidatus Acidoferrales bacterium]